MVIGTGQLIVWLIVGAIAGFIAGQLFRGRGFGMLGNVIIGLLGGLLGGLLFQLFGIRIGGPTLSISFSLADLLVAIIGALILLFIVRAVTRRA
jgi:uncharacterized membrane protein YeaQ/YmgE (transglycosylase-associated protein family)